MQRDRLPLDRGPNLSVLGKMGATVRMVGVLDQVRCDLPSDLEVHFRRPLAISWNPRRCENSRAVSKVRKADKQATVASENDLNDLVSALAALHGQDDSFRAKSGNVRGLVSTASGLHSPMIARRHR